MAEPPLSELLLVLLSPLSQAPPPPQNQASLLPADARACAISWHLASNLCMAFTRSLRRNLISTVPAGSSTPPLRDEKDKTECLVCSVLIAYIYKRSWPWIYLPPVDEVFQAFRLKYCVVVLYIFFSQSAGRRSKILIIWYLSVDRNSLEKAYYVLLLAGKR